MLAAGEVKVDDAAHGAVVGQGGGRLPQLFEPVHQVMGAAGRDADAAVKTVIAVQVQVDEAHTFTSFSSCFPLMVKRLKLRKASAVRRPAPPLLRTDRRRLSRNWRPSGSDIQ